MFTGLVQSLGTVETCTPDGAGGLTLTVRDAVAKYLTLGESVAVNGACLTVVEFNAEAFRFQVGPETVNLTNLGGLRPGSRVNLERALRIGDLLGGHFVTGHIDATGTIARREMQGEWEMVEFDYDPKFDELLVKKGSIAVDGVSLTVASCGTGAFTVMLIPHTQHATTLGTKRVGDAVNLEFDLIAKHLKKMMQNMTVNI